MDNKQLENALQALAHAANGDVVVRYVAIIEAMNPNGEIDTTMYANPGLRYSETLGLLEFSKQWAIEAMRRQA